MLSINTVNSACFLKDTIFISTHKRISNTAIQTHPKNFPTTLFFALTYWHDRYFWPVAGHPVSYPAPRCTYTPLGNLWLFQKFSESVYRHPGKPASTSKVPSLKKKFPASREKKVLKGWIVKKPEPHGLHPWGTYRRGPGCHRWSPGKTLRSRYRPP